MTNLNNTDPADFQKFFYGVMGSKTVEHINAIQKIAVAISNSEGESIGLDDELEHRYNAAQCKLSEAIDELEKVFEHTSEVLDAIEGGRLAGLKDWEIVNEYGR